jgi:hypothetical protein
MPHSVSSNPSLEPVEEGGVLPEAPSEAAETPEQSSTEENQQSQDQEEIEKIKREIKLEDLFNGDDDEDEFISSGSTNDSKMEVDSSPPKPPYFAYFALRRLRSNNPLDKT